MVAAALAFGQGSAEVDLKAAMHKEQVEGDLNGAIAAYRKIVAQHGKNRAVAAQALLQMAQCHEKLGESEARKIYEQLVRSYGDQAAVVAQAKAKLGGAAQLGLRRTEWIRPGCFEFPDGGRLKGCSGEGGLAIIDMVTGKETVIPKPSNEPGVILTGRGSPDGTRFAYVEQQRNGTSILRVVRPGQEEPRELGTVGALLAWSPDSRSVLVTAPELKAGRAELQLVTVADGARKALGGSLKGAFPEGTVFSPDGAYIVYSTTAWGTPSDLRVLTVATGEDAPLITNQGDARVVGWHKDGWLLYTSNPTGVRDLFRMRMRGATAAGPAELLHRDLDVRLAQMGPDGNVHYMLSGNTSNVFRATLNEAGTAFAGEPAIVSKRYENVTRFGRYSRDGKWVAFDTGWRGAAKLVVLNVETGEETERLSPFVRINSLEWYPDRSALLVHGTLSQGGAFGLHRFDLRSGEVRTVLAAKGLRGDLATNPTFSADGRSVFLKYFDTADGLPPDDYSRMHLARLHLQSGQVTEVFRPKAPQILRFFAVSPDGTQIVYGFRDGKRDAYGVVPVGGGEPRVIFRCDEGEWSRSYSALAFTGDGKGIVLHRVTKRNRTADKPAGDADELWHIPLDGGAPSRLHDTNGWTLTMMGRPNSREIIWQAARVGKPEFWVMENVTTAVSAAR
jgi:Tol biopolymer transport system component